MPVLKITGLIYWWYDSTKHLIDTILCLPKEEKTLVWYFWLYTTLTLVICKRILLHNLYLLARTMIIKRYWRSSTYVVVCAIASDNAIKISNPTESFKIQTKAVVWPAKIKVIQDYNIRLNEKKIYKTWGARIQWHMSCSSHFWYVTLFFRFFITLVAWFSLRCVPFVYFFLHVLPCKINKRLQYIFVFS